MSIADQIFNSIETKLELLKNYEQVRGIRKAGDLIINVFNNGNKLLIAGNGGSAADAQHFVAELVGKFTVERKGLPALALTTNSSVLTAISNDFEPNQIFVRQLEALARPGDIFFGISTSGNTNNLVEAVKRARENGLTTIGLLGKDGGRMKDYCNLSVIVPSKNTQNIQEAHIMIIHILSRMVDEAFGESKI